jgi:CheY-like chemotaxis protein
MSKKLLLADDSVTIQRVIELTFSGEDVQVLTASDGEEAVARIAADKPDIVLADIGMPKRSGYEVSAFVKGKPELSHIPVLLLAGAFEPVDEAKAKEVHCDGVLVKPFEPQQVIARVRELIGGAKGSPTQPAVSDIPRPAAVLTAPRPVALPKREERPAASEDLMEFGAQDLLAPTFTRSLEELLPVDDFLPPVESLESAVPPLVLDDSLDDYFDKLDEAFATITTSAPLGTAPAETVAGRREGPVLPDARPAGRVDPFGDLGALDAIQPNDAAVPTRPACGNGARIHDCRRAADRRCATAGRAAGNDTDADGGPRAARRVPADDAAQHRGGCVQRTACYRAGRARCRADPSRRQWVRARDLRAHD